jgi:excisionase family DNA binding protein
MTENTSEWLDTKQAAPLLGVTPRTLQNWQARRLLPFFKIGRCIRYKRSDIEQHLATRCRVEAR